MVCPAAAPLDQIRDVMRNEGKQIGWVIQVISSKVGLGMSSPGVQTVPNVLKAAFNSCVFLTGVSRVLQISRQSIDALKDWFRDEMQKSDWQLIVELKKVFEII